MPISTQRDKQSYLASLSVGLMHPWIVTVFRHSLSCRQKLSRTKSAQIMARLGFFVALSLVAKTVSQCTICGCDTCIPEEFFTVGNPSADLDTSIIPEKFLALLPPDFVLPSTTPCATLDALANTPGLFPPEACVDELRLIPEFRETCECPPVPAEPRDNPVPSDVPSDLPSDFPSDVPSDLPSQAPQTL